MGTLHVNNFSQGYETPSESEAALYHFSQIIVKIYLDFSTDSVCWYNIGKWYKKVSLKAWVRIM